MKHQTSFLGEEKMVPLLIRLSSPAMVGMMVQAAYNLVDTLFVGWGVGVLAIGGLAIAFPLQMLIMAMAQTVGIGGASIISRSLGAGKIQRANHTLGNMIATVVLLGLILAVSGIIYLEPLLFLLGSSPDIFPYAYDYMEIILIGTVVFAFSITTNNVVRAEGNAKFAMMTMIISAGVNTLLDPIFIFGLKMGVQGAAWATVISQGSTAAWLAWYFLSGKSTLRIRAEYLKPHLSILKETFSIGISAFTRQGTASLMLVVLNHRLGIYGGDVAIAAFGILRRMLLFLIMPIFGMVQGLLPVVGYNYGARKLCRVKEAMKISITFSSGLAIANFILFFFFPAQLLSLFTRDPKVLRIGITAARIIALGLPVDGFQVMASGMYQAVGKALPAFLLSMLRQVLLLIPLVILLPHLWGLTGIWIAFPIADTGAALITLVMFIGEMRHLKRVCD